MTKQPIVLPTEPDPFGRDVPLHHRRELRLFGLPLVVESNAEPAMEFVDYLFGAADHASPSDTPISRAPMRFRIVVEPSRTGGGTPPTTWRMPDEDHVIFAGPGVLGSLDLAAASGVVFAEEWLMRHEGGSGFAHGMVQGPILTLATRRDRHPIHAAALRRGDRALLLHGPSGAGKSTLAYLASRAGIDVLSDDAIRVQREPTLRVWGGGARRSGHVHLCEDVHERFVEADARVAARVRTGAGVKYIIPVAAPSTAPATPAPPFVHHVRVCLLERERGPVACHAVSADEIVHAILSAPEARSDLYEPGRRGAAEAIGARGGWRLRLSREPEEALPIVLDLLDAR